MKKVKRPSLRHSIKKLTQKKKDYVYITYHGPMKGLDRRVNQVVGTLLTGEIVGKNWYGSFSSGHCGIISFWHWDTREQYYLDLYRQLLNTFQTINEKKNGWVYHHPELEVNRANGNIGSRSIAFNATKENIALVETLMSQLGLKVIVNED